MVDSRLKTRFRYTVATLLIIVSTGTLLAIPFFNPSLSIYITVLAVGASLALQKYIASFVGYFVIRLSSIFDIGDRIRIGNIKGDVKHIGLFHIIVDEVGDDEKMGGELTGRLLHIPNLVVLDQPVLNYSKDYSVEDEMIACDYIFDEIRIPLSPKSDIRKAASILEDLLKVENTAFMKEARKAFGDGQPNFVHDLESGQKVTIYIDEKQIWIKGRFVTPIKARNEFKTRISMGFIDRIRGDDSIEIRAD